jgi:hypothetical protein
MLQIFSSSVPSLKLVATFPEIAKMHRLGCRISNAVRNGIGKKKTALHQRKVQNCTEVCT